MNTEHTPNADAAQKTPTPIADEIEKVAVWLAIEYKHGHILAQDFPARFLEAINPARQLETSLAQAKEELAFQNKATHTVAVRAAQAQRDLQSARASLAKAEQERDEAKMENEKLKLFNEAGVRGANEVWKLLEEAGYVPCNNGWVGETRRALVDLAELRRDRERIDWLDENMSYHGGGNGGTYSFVTPADVESGLLRAAIDAARRAQQEGKKP